MIKIFTSSIPPSVIKSLEAPAERGTSHITYVSLATKPNAAYFTVTGRSFQEVSCIRLGDTRADQYVPT